MRKRGFPQSPAFFPVLAFFLWFYSFFSYFAFFETNSPGARTLLEAQFYLANLILVLNWFLCPRPVFLTFAGTVAALSFYFFLLWQDAGVLIEALTVALIGGWLFYLSRRVANEKLEQIVSHEKMRSRLNVEHLGLTEKEHLHAALLKKLERLNYLREFSDRLKDCVGTKKIGQVIAREAAKLIPRTDQALILTIDEKTHEPGLAARWSREHALSVKKKKGDEYDQWTLRRSQPLLIEDTSSDIRFTFDREKDAEWRSVCIAPLVSEERAFGVLRLNARKERSFQTEDLRFLDILADLSSVSLKNALLYDKTKELSIIDSLTECMLLRYVRERLEEEVRRSLRSKLTFSVLMVDIDHFKDYNDQHGHTAGDLVLRAVAGILKASSGPSDIVGRYGGEEFVLILPERRPEEAFEAAEDIRKKIEAKEFFIRNVRQHTTVSIGISSFPGDGSTGEELLWKADQNLYKAKRKGRNRTVIDSP